MKKLLILLLLVCSLSAGTYDRGVKAYKQKNYTKAYRLLGKSAKNNNIKAQLFVANMHLHGLGVDEDYKKAGNWYRKILKRKSYVTKRKDIKKWLRGNFGNIARKYEGRDGDTKNYQEAAFWYKKSALLGSDFAQYFLGEIYHFGKGKVEKDVEKAFQWYLKSARQGYTHAEARVAYMYHTGEGVPADRVKSDYWLKKISKKDNEFAKSVVLGVEQEKLFERGSQYYDGNGVDKNHQKAFELFEKSAQLGHKISQFNIGRMYLDGDSVSRDKTKALLWLEKAAKQGHKSAIVTLELLSAKPSVFGLNSLKQHIRSGEQNRTAQKKQNQSQTVPKKESNPISKLEQDAVNGHTNAQYNLATAYYTGKGMVLDMKKAFVWYKKAAESGQALAQDMLGWFYFNGKSVRKDMSKAIHWYTKSAAQNNHSAQRALGWIYLLKAVPVNYEKSIGYFTQAIKGDPSTIDNHFYRAYAYHELKQYRNAIQDYETELTKNPKGHATLNNLAAIYATADDANIVDAKKAIRIAMKAYKIKRDLYIMSVLAAAYARDGQYKKAIEFSEQAMTMMKKDSKEYEDEQVAMVQYRAGKPYTRY